MASRADAGSLHAARSCSGSWRTNDATRSAWMTFAIQMSSTRSTPKRQTAVQRTWQESGRRLADRSGHLR